MSENKIAKKPLFNPDGDIEVNNRRLLNFNTTNINDFNNMKYSWVSDWYRPVSYTHLTLPTSDLV